LDRLDIRILGQLYRGVSKIGFRPDVKGMYGSMAEKLEIDEDTVRKRVDRLHSMGVIRGWQLVVNPHVFGLDTYAVWMTVDSELKIEETMRKIRLVHGILTIAREMGNVVSMGMVCENESVFRKRVELISELTGGKQLASYAVAQPKSEVEPTSTDWQIINAITPDPLGSYTRVAEKLGLSSRTVQRRITRLINGKVIFFLPNVDFSHLEGASWVSLLVSYAESGFKDRIERSIFTKFEDYVLQVAWSDAGYGYFEFIIPNIHLVEEIADWTRTQRGIGDVRVNFNYERQNFYDDVLDEIKASRVKGTRALPAE